MRGRPARGERQGDLRRRADPRARPGRRSCVRAGAAGRDRSVRLIPACPIRGHTRNRSRASAPQVGGDPPPRGAPVLRTPPHRKERRPMPRTAHRARRRPRPCRRPRAPDPSRRPGEAAPRPGSRPQALRKAGGPLPRSPPGPDCQGSTAPTIARRGIRPRRKASRSSPRGRLDRSDRVAWPPAHGDPVRAAATGPRSSSRRRRVATTPRSRPSSRTPRRPAWRWSREGRAPPLTGASRSGEFP